MAIFFRFRWPTGAKRREKSAPMTFMDLSRAIWSREIIDQTRRPRFSPGEDALYGHVHTMPSTTTTTTTTTHTKADDVDPHPHVLSPPLMESLQVLFPPGNSGDNFWMKEIYSMVLGGGASFPPCFSFRSGTLAQEQHLTPEAVALGEDLLICKA
jgi:hypothetical protein